LTFVNLPLLVLDVFLLAEAGFRPIEYAAGLFWMQLMIALYFVLPLAALATITATVVQTLLALLLLVLYGIGMGLLSDQIPNAGFSGPVDSLTAALLFGVCLAVIWMQYAQRRTNNSRALMAALAGVLLLILVATPYRSLVAREFPQLSGGQQAPFQLALLPAVKVESESAPQEEDQKEIEIRLPLGVSGLEAESIAAVDGVMVSLEAPDGLQWDSGWKARGQSLFPDYRTTEINFVLKRRVFERIGSARVKFRLSIAFTLFHDTHRREFVTPPGVFRMEDIGLCSAETNYSQTIRCLAPLHGPESLLITTDMSMSTCAVPEGESPAAHGELARDWIRGGSEPAEFGISPVKTVNLYLANWNGAARRLNPGICPGTPLVLSSPKPVRRNQIALQIDGVRLSDYRLRPPKVVRFATHRARP
jgi:hypothetical protein